MNKFITSSVLALAISTGAANAFNGEAFAAGLAATQAAVQASQTEAPLSVVTDEQRAGISRLANEIRAQEAASFSGGPLRVVTSEDRARISVLADGIRAEETARMAAEETALRASISELANEIRAEEAAASFSGGPLHVVTDEERAEITRLAGVIAGDTRQITPEVRESISALADEIRTDSFDGGPLRVVTDEERAGISALADEIRTEAAASTPTIGVDGVDGVDGQDGQDGVDGTDGVDGRDGVDGQDGATGAKGDKGDTGAAGRDGVDGTDASVDMKALNKGIAGNTALNFANQGGEGLGIGLGHYKGQNEAAFSYTKTHNDINYSAGFTTSGHVGGAVKFKF